MAIITDREPATVTTVSDESAPASFVAVLLGLIVIAVIGYMIYAFNHNASTVTPDMNAPQSGMPLTAPQSPTPGPAPGNP